MKLFEITNMKKSDGCSTKFRKGGRLAANHRHAAKNAIHRFCSLKNIKGVCTLWVTIREMGTGKTETFKGKRFLNRDGKYVVKLTSSRAPSVKRSTVCKRSSGKARMFKRRSPRRVSPYAFARLRARSLF
jgi:hypothetical protein